MNQGDISLVILFAAIHVIVFLTFHYGNSHALDFFRGAVVYLQFLALLATDIDSGSSKVNLSSTVDALVWIT